MRFCIIRTKYDSRPSRRSLALADLGRYLIRGVKMRKFILLVLILTGFVDALDLGVYTVGDSARTFVNTGKKIHMNYSQLSNAFTAINDTMRGDITLLLYSFTANTNAYLSKPNNGYNLWIVAPNNINGVYRDTIRDSSGTLGFFYTDAIVKSGKIIIEGLYIKSFISSFSTFYIAPTPGQPFLLYIFRNNFFDCSIAYRAWAYFITGTSAVVCGNIFYKTAMSGAGACSGGSSVLPF